MGLGETEIISLAVEENIPCLIDDIKAQRIGMRLNLDFKSTPVILIELLKSNYFSLKTFEKYIEDYGRIANLSQTELWFYKKVGELIK